MVKREVADGIRRITHADVNVYLIEDEDGVTLVDTGLPATFRHITAALRDMGRTPAEVRAVLLTHAHFDHVGSAKRAHETWGVPVFAHDGDRELAAHPYRYKRERNPLRYPLKYPRSVAVLGKMALAGALVVRGLDDILSLQAGSRLPVPGRPRVVFTPGHTLGHCALHLPERDVVLSGDALVTLDPYTGGKGPQIVAGAATADSPMALASLAALADTGAHSVLPGHGEPWTGGAATAVELAVRAGPH
ncbi:MBL fold metallo-hydrolase [Nocardia sienata]|uniref:MBL fold metallo-hydrolase n=1 Tax=Nocardia sienata TaxID=248552 RepID=UPI0007A40243|nr:MBL fold metallo-hydrolase [Nocardia sienata]